jgi:hypothetical protein
LCAPGEVRGDFEFALGFNLHFLSSTSKIPNDQIFSSFCADHQTLQAIEKVQCLHGKITLTPTNDIKTLEMFSSQPQTSEDVHKLKVNNNSFA